MNVFVLNTKEDILENVGSSFVFRTNTLKYSNMLYIFYLINILWRGGRGKATRARGRAGSETSGGMKGK